MQLDNCAPLAALVIVALIGAIMYRAIETGFPAIASGDMPIWVPTVGLPPPTPPTSPPLLSHYCLAWYLPMADAMLV